MDEPMGRRTVGGLLFTKGGSILLFREDGSQHRAKSCCSRGGCSSRHSAAADKAKGKETHRAVAAPAAPNESTSATPRRSQIFKNSNRKPPQPQPHESSGSASSGNAVRRDGGGSSAGSETGGNRSRDNNHGRDLLARLKERVNASRKRSLTRESSPPSPSNGFSASSSPSSRNIVSRPSHRAASRIRKADEGPSAAASDRPRRNGTRVDARRRNHERSDDDLLLVDQATAAAAEGFLSGFTARYRSGFQGTLSSLEDTIEGSNGYWRFDMGGTEELESYFIFSDRHRGMRMDIDGMSYEELLALGERIGTVNTGLSEDALSKCLNRSLYMPTASSSHEDGDRKCSICQEEYIAGEEVGNMACKHYYHTACIQHWLRQKNWCPICKSVAQNTD